MASEEPLVGCLRYPVGAMVVAATAKSPEQLSAITHEAAIEELELGHPSRPQDWESVPDLHRFTALKLLIVWASRWEAAPDLEGVSLRSLYLAGNQTLVDVENLRGQNELEALILGGKHLANLSPLRDLPLQFLMAKRSKLSQLSSLPLSSLRSLDASSTRLRGLDGVDAPELEYLAVSSTRIKTLAGIDGAPELRRFMAWKCKSLSVVEPLLACKHLSIVNLNQTRVDGPTIEALLDLPEVNLIGCARTPAADSELAPRLQAKAEERKITLCFKEREFAMAYGFERRDVDYYLRVHQGDLLLFPVEWLGRFGGRPVAPVVRRDLTSEKPNIASC